MSSGSTAAACNKLTWGVRGEGGERFHANAMWQRHALMSAWMSGSFASLRIWAASQLRPRQPLSWYLAAISALSLERELLELV